ncbi:MAG: bifunctional glutamate N-acetyltransferase/amino-acid acetyltransferase ArgJ [Anaerolineales bacterium]|nr:bifunctional glutamate N-acetyltransferase/amino-acid acetyltransferase ArgJ [Anaerolineales bacterium]
MPRSNETDHHLCEYAYQRDGSVTTPRAFSAGTASSGLKTSGGLDLALIVSNQDCNTAGVFTKNRLAAAPVIICRETLAQNPNRIRAVVANAGVANACTGQAGLDSARQMQEMSAEALGCAPHQVLVLSTGVIGEPLDLDRVSPGIRQAAKNLSREQGVAAATAIMTTDKYPKHASLGVELSGGYVLLGGIAKGAGMIHPDMATMLAVITADANLPVNRVNDLLAGAVATSFNCISVDGDTSTNDSVILMANGASGVEIRNEKDYEIFADALKCISQELAQMIVRDGEGATKFVTLHVSGARNMVDARQVGRTVAASPLVKTAIHGGDPNWGRIMAAIGRSGVSVDPERISVSVSAPSYPESFLVENGRGSAQSTASIYEIFRSSELSIEIALGVGSARATLWTCDFSEEYVEINAEYHT